MALVYNPVTAQMEDDGTGAGAGAPQAGGAATTTTGGWTWEAVHEAFPQLERWPNWLIEVLNHLDAISSGQQAAPVAKTMAYLQSLKSAAGAGASDDDLDDIKNAFLSGAAPSGTTVAPTTTGRAATGGGGSTAQPTEFQTIWGNMSPEDRQRYIQIQMGGATPWQTQQWQAQQDAAQRAFDLQNRQFAWQQEQAARAEEERRKERVATLNANPRDWATLWSMYGGDKGLPAGYTAPALEAGVTNPSWAAALQGQPNAAATGSVTTQTPLPSILRGAIEGSPTPTGGMFRMPEGAGVLPSAQYLNELPGTALAGLGGVYGKDFGLSFADILQAVQRSLPRKSVGQVASMGALAR